MILAEHHYYIGNTLTRVRLVELKDNLRIVEYVKPDDVDGAGNPRWSRVEPLIIENALITLFQVIRQRNETITEFQKELQREKRSRAKGRKK